MGQRATELESRMMSEPHAEPPAADVRSFLPRPGEPVEDYAARLRALHEDLSLVLDAVERGLAAAEAEPAPVRPVAPVVPVVPVVPVAPVEAVPEPHRSPPPPGPLSPPRGNARVEVISTPATAHGHAGGEGAWSGPPEPEGAAPRRRAPMGEGGPVGGDPAAPSPERWPPHPGGGYGGPWVESVPPPPRAEPWVERGASGWPPPPPPPAEMTFTPSGPSAPPHAPGAWRSPGPRAPSLFVAAALLGWLIALALVIALAFGL